MITPYYFNSVINSYLPEPHASLLNGILFGIQLDKHSLFYEQLKITGLLHMVVLSGMNITILAVIVGHLMSFTGKRIALVITILTIYFFVIFVRPEAPIVRAGIMGILTFVGMLYGKTVHSLFLLFLSAFLIALIKPVWFTQISLYLSFGATLGLILFSSSPGKGNYLLDELRTSLAAQVFTAPLIFVFFKQVSFISPISNILVSWAVAPLMIFGFLAALLGKLHYVFGYVFSLVCYGILSYMIFVIEILSSIPYASINF